MKQKEEEKVVISKVDFTKKIKNSDKFRQAAIQYINTGSYCQYPTNTTEYFKFWDEETKRCIDGYTAPDGDYITGYHYFYINYCPILRIVNKIIEDKQGNTRVKRTSELTFPDFYDYDYYYFQAIQEAEELGKHICLIKSRRKGFSYKGGSMACRNFYLIPASKSYIYASNKQYLTEDGIITKAWEYMDFIDKNTAWAKKRQVTNTQLHRKASMIVTDEYGNRIETGYKSEIIGVSLKDNPHALRGKRAKLILFEEGGTFSELATAWQVARPSVEQDGITFGLMIVWGCVCAGTKVWTNNGNCVNIETISKEDGILGYNTYQAVRQDIENINPPITKPCLRITTNTGKTLECSTDHPILWSNRSLTTRVKGSKTEVQKTYKWHEAGLIKVGEQVAVIDEIPYFGKLKMWEPRLVGMLIGDGSYGKDKTPVFSNCDNELNEYIYSRYNCVLESSRITKNNKIYKETRIRGICPRLRELGIYGQTKINKRLPDNIHMYNRESLLELIGGLFDTDGYIRSSSKQCKIELTQASKEILLEIQNVLLHFGIHSTVRTLKSRNRSHITNSRTIIDRNPSFRLEINDKMSLLRFSEYVHLLVDYKQAALDTFNILLQDTGYKMSKYIHGVRFERVTKIENIGQQKVYNLTAGGNHNYICNGIITHNTGGDTGSKFEPLKKMFYKPAGYNCLGFKNIWDEGYPDQPCGFFVPQYTNMDVRDDDGNRLYMDEDGNTKVRESTEYILQERREMISNAVSAVEIDRFVAERPITPAEAMLEFNGNIFPKKELMAHLNNIRTHKNLQNHKQIGDLVFDNSGQLQWIPKKHGDITKYPLEKNDDPTGSIVIWEHPVRDASVGLYIAGIDSYDYDQSSSSTSLGSCLIYKRFQNFEQYYDIIVAEYTGRPETAEQFYENVRKLLLYYNARAMYENQNKGLFVYFTNKHCDYLLADQPDIINDIVGDSKVQRKKGCHMNAQIKQWGEGMIKDWLNEEQSPGKKNLHNILSEPLLEELISYNDSGNFDRIMSLIQIMIYKEQLYNVVVKKKEKENKNRMLFDGPIFAQSWFNEVTPSIFDDSNTYTF